MRGYWYQIVILTLLQLLATLSLGLDPQATYIMGTVPTTIEAEFTYTIEVQAMDGPSSPKTSGGDTLVLLVTKPCSMTTELGGYLCQFDTTTAYSHPPNNLIVSVEMIHTTSGIYTADFAVTGGHGDVSLSVVWIQGAGIKSWFYNNSDWTGLVAEPIRNQIDNDWGQGYIHEASASNHVSARWAGYVKSPFEGDIHFRVMHNDDARIWIGGEYHEQMYCCGDWTVTVKAKVGDYIPFRLDWKEIYRDAYIKLWWQYTSISWQPVPQSAFFYGQNIGGSVHAVPSSIYTSPTTVPEKSDIVSAATITIAGEAYTMEVQSKNGSGTAHDVPTDRHKIIITEDSGPFSHTLDPLQHQSGGKYSETVPVDTLITKGFYTADLTCENDYTDTYQSISKVLFGSPFAFEVKPARPDPTKSHFNQNEAGIGVQTAGVSKDFVYSYIDRFDNLHEETMQDEIDSDGLEPKVTALYIHHDNWPSPLDVEDLQDWETIYGTYHEVSGTDIVVNADGTTKATMTISKAGVYELKTTIYGEDLMNSIHLPTYYEVRPNILNAPTSVPVGVDLLEEICAGYEWNFQIQGRDVYHNNVDYLLEDAVDDDHYITLTKSDDEKIVVEGEVSDFDEGPGTYNVEVQLPKTLKDGLFDFTVMLGGLQVPTPQITVLPCSNTIAGERGMISKDGIEIVLDDIGYNAGEEAVTMELPAIPFHCEHKPVFILTTAQRVLKGGKQTTTAISTIDELAEYGIVVQPYGLFPSIEVFTDELLFIDATYELEFSATVEEETTWANKVTLNVNIFAQPSLFVPPSIETEEAPTFDSKSVYDSMLQLMEDESGAQFLIPVFTDCNSEWVKSLPAIDGEDDGEKFEISVSLDKADKFLSYTPYSREFAVKPSTKEESQEFYTITISLKASNGKKSTYTLRVSYKCIKEKVNKEETDETVEELRYDENPPTPYIYSISAFGEVRVRFNETMSPMVALSEQEQSRPRRLQKSAQEEEIDIVTGFASQSFRNYSRVHNSTFEMEGVYLPSIEVTIEPSDPDSQCSKLLDFVWELVEFSPDELVFQLKFDRPECVSIFGGNGDLLIITFNDQRLFEGQSGSLIWPKTQVTKNLNRQLAAEGAEKEALDAVAGSASQAVIATSFVNVLTNILLQGSLSSLISALKNLQIIVHVMLIQVFLVAHAGIFLMELQKLIAFELFDMTDIAQATFGSQSGNPLDMNFEAMGYETSDMIINAGPIGIVIFVVPPFLLLIFILKKFCCSAKVRNFSEKQLKKTFFNRILTYFDASFLILGVCCAVNIYQVYVGIAPKDFSYYFAILVIFSINPYLIGLLGYLCRKFKDLDSENIKKRVGNSYENLGLDRAGRPALVTIFLSYTRRVALCFVITFGRSTIVGQLFFMNFCSILVMAFVGIVRPYKTAGGNRLELFNEFTVLLLYCHCVTQTDFVQDMRGRMASGWSLIVVIAFNILINFGNMIIGDLFIVYRKIKLYVMKKKWQERLSIERERRERVSLYRQIILDDLRKQGKLDEDDAENADNFMRQGGNELIKLKIRKQPAAGADQQQEDQPQLIEAIVMAPDDIMKQARSESGKQPNATKTLQTLAWQQPSLKIETKSRRELATFQPKMLLGPQTHSDDPMARSPYTVQTQTTVSAITRQSWQQQPPWHRSDSSLQQSSKVVTKQMLQTLYDEEVSKLESDPSYSGGGFMPPYGPRVEINISDLHRLGKDAYRRRYLVLLGEAIEKAPF